MIKNMQKHFESIRKAVTDRIPKVLEKKKRITKATEQLIASNLQVKFFKEMNESGVVSASLNRPLAKFIVPGNKNQVRLPDDVDNDNCNDFVMDAESKTI